MRTIAGFMFCLLLGCAATTNSVPEGDWEKFEAVSNRYYYLDDQKFSSVTCRVVVSTLNENLSLARENLAPVKDKVSIIENLKDFRLTLNRAGELSFVKPTVYVKITSTEGLPDPERVRTGTEQLKNGFKMQVEGTIKVLQGTFEYLGRPKRETFGTISVSGTKDPVKISYEKGSFTGNMVIDGDTRHMTSQGPNFHSDMTDKFSKFKGLLLPVESETTIKQPGIELHVKARLQHQELKGLYFPKAVSAKTDVQMKSMKQQGSVEILLDECRVE